MSVVSIPIDPTLQAQRLSVPLDGVTYNLVLRRNARDGAIYLDIEDADGKRKRSGIRLVTNWPLLTHFERKANDAGGQLLVVDTRDQPLEPTKAEFGSTQPLVYVEKASLP
jgi:hypothetical protein